MFYSSWRVILVGFLCLFSFVFPGTARERESFQVLSVSATTRKELQLKFTQSFRFPLFAGEGALTRNNNVLVNLSADVTPVSVNGNAEVILTPIAFLQFVAGAGAGSGWNIPFADGLRINEPGRNPDGTLDGTNELTGNAFDGIVWKVRGGAVLQFDYAVLRPGDWNHVIFRTYHGLQYRSFTAAGRDDSWMYENCAGEARNGWVYYGNYLLGYQMPVRLNLVGLLIEEEKNLYTTDGRLYWGDDISRWTFGLLGVYEITPTISVTGMVQMRTTRKFEGNSGSYGFYQLRNIDRDDPRELEFYRAGVTFEKRF